MQSRADSGISLKQQSPTAYAKKKNTPNWRQQTSNYFVLQPNVPICTSKRGLCNSCSITPRPFTDDYTQGLYESTRTPGPKARSRTQRHLVVFILYGKIDQEIWCCSGNNYVCFFFLNHARAQGNSGREETFQHFYEHTWRGSCCWKDNLHLNDPTT